MENNIRDKIWYFLVDSKTNEFYLNLLVTKYQKWDLYLNIFLVFTTSSSVGAWAIWKKYPTIWVVIIAISQLLIILKPYFLFPKYVKVFSEKIVHLQNLSVQLEKLWHNLNEKNIDEKKASDKFFELRQKSLAIEKMSDDLIHTEDEKALTLSEKKAEIYLKKI